MTFQIEMTRRGTTKFLKNAINLKPHSFGTAEDAQKFADSCLANERCDWKNQGRRLPAYRVVAR